MNDLLRDGQRWLSDQLTQHVSRLVVYRRGPLGVELNATLGRTQYEQDHETGVTMRSQMRDYLINTDELLQSIIGSLPQSGDQIVEIEQDETVIFEVMSPAGDAPWRYSDPYRFKLRIHTRQVRR